MKKRFGLDELMKMAATGQPINLPLRNDVKSYISADETIAYGLRVIDTERTVDITISAINPVVARKQFSRESSPAPLHRIVADLAIRYETFFKCFYVSGAPIGGHEDHVFKALAETNGKGLHYGGKDYCLQLACLTPEKLLESYAREEARTSSTASGQ